MEKFIRHTGLAAVMDRANVDTDLIVPKQFLKRVEREGFGEFCFYNLRYDEAGAENPQFELNADRFRGASVLVARENFGCGSSREHAPWALLDYGFRAIIAPSFADIFFNNAFKNGILLIKLDNEVISDLMERIMAHPGYQLTIDLEEQIISGPDGFQTVFEVDEFKKWMLLEGMDDISLTLQHEDAIAAYEAGHNQPWQAAVAGA